VNDRLQRVLIASALILSTALPVAAAGGAGEGERDSAQKPGPVPQYLDPTPKPWLAGTRDEPWRFMAASYLWLPNAPLKLDLGPISTQLPEDLPVILDSLQFALMMHFEGRKGRFGGYFAPIFIWLRDDDQRVQGPVQEHKIIISESAFLADFGLSYEVWRWKMWDRPSWFVPAPVVTFEPFFGGRTLADGITIEFDPPGSKVKPDITFVAPVLGLRTFWGLTDRVHLRIEGDGGGWGVDGLDQTWNFLGLAAWRFRPTENVSVDVYAGYRYLNIEYEDTASLSLDVKGPLLGVSLDF